MDELSRNEQATLEWQAGVLPLLPIPEVYEKEYQYWPWGILIEKTIDWVRGYANHSSVIVDYMCGTGFLLNNISKQRPDLRLYGCSLTPPYIEYAHRVYPHLNITLQDVMDYRTEVPPDIIICTAGLHHLDKGRQPDFIKKVSSELSTGKHFILGEEVIRPYVDDQDRRIAVLELWTALISSAIKKNAPDKVLEAAADALMNDLFERGEYKLTRAQIEEMLRQDFIIDSVVKTWPDNSESYGDLLFICRRR